MTLTENKNKTKQHEEENNSSAFKAWMWQLKKLEKIKIVFEQQGVKVGYLCNFAVQGNCLSSKHLTSCFFFVFFSFSFFFLFFCFVFFCFCFLFFFKYARQHFFMTSLDKRPLFTLHA